MYDRSSRGVQEHRCAGPPLRRLALPSLPWGRNRAAPFQPCPRSASGLSFPARPPAAATASFDLRPCRGRGERERERSNATLPPEKTSARSGSPRLGEPEENRSVLSSSTNSRGWTGVSLALVEVLGNAGMPPRGRRNRAVRPEGVSRKNVSSQKGYSTTERGLRLAESCVP